MPWYWSGMINEIITPNISPFHKMGTNGDFSYHQILKYHSLYMIVFKHPPKSSFEGGLSPAPTNPDL